MSNVCEGCQKGFADKGFYRHLRSTRVVLCVAEAARLGIWNPNASPSQYSRRSGTRKPEENASDEDDIPLATDSSGDYFGDYDDLDIDTDINMNNNPPSDSDDDEPEVPENEEDESEDDEFAAAAADCEHGWEPPVDDLPSRPPSPGLDQQEPVEHIYLPPPRPHRNTIDPAKRPFIEHYRDHRAGEPIGVARRTADEEYADGLGQSPNMYTPWLSEKDWGIARWAKMRGPSSNALAELLSIPGVPQDLGLSFTTPNELNHIIDTELPSHRPRFQAQEVVVQGEAYTAYFRDIIECVRALFGDSEFLPYLKFVPERHFSDAAHTKRLYYDMNTGKWWWSTQEKVDREVRPGGTVVPIIISSDKTQVTLFRNKSAYPIYLTIGNIPKEIRRKPSCRAYVLLGYLPTTKLDHITNKASRRRCLANLFHACMRFITAPLVEAGLNGVTMASGDGVERRAHLIFAVYVGDYPEQVLVCCCMTGQCPICEVPRDEVGEDTGQHPFRDIIKILDALQKADDGAGAFIDACAEVGIKPIFDPFWAHLPFSNVFRAITPDILHQLYQGVFKHVKAWVFQAYSPAELDARCRRFPPNHNIRLFMKGISSLSSLTGHEHDQIARFFLGLLIEARLPDGMSSIRLIRCVRAILDFLFIAQFPLHSDDTLAQLADARQRFHDNKSIFVDLGIRQHFQIPKLHFLDHYVSQIEMFGTLDNCNTEYTERLHIDMAKEAYRATNKKDEYPQMTQWLERREKIMRHEKFVQWRLSGGHLRPRVPWISPALDSTRVLKMTKHPSSGQVVVDELPQSYGIPFFHAAFARFVLQLRNPALSGAALEDAVDVFRHHVTRIYPFYRIKFISTDFFTGVSSTADSIHVEPSHVTRAGKSIPARFDTALIDISAPDSDGPANRRFRIGQVRLVFNLPDKIHRYTFRGIDPDDQPDHMAYIEWFTPFERQPDNVHGLYKVSRCNIEGGTLASIVDIRRIERSVHLFPRFGPVAPRDWTSSNVLNECRTFFMNTYSDRHMFQLFSP